MSDAFEPEEIEPIGDGVGTRSLSEWKHDTSRADPSVVSTHCYVQIDFSAVFQHVYTRDEILERYGFDISGDEDFTEAQLSQIQQDAAAELWAAMDPLDHVFIDTDKPLGASIGTGTPPKEDPPN